MNALIKKCSLTTFTTFLNLPLILSRRLYVIFSKNGNYLFEEDFVNGMLKLFFGSSYEIVELFFNIFNISDDVIHLQDILLTFKFLTSDQKEIVNYEKVINSMAKRVGFSLNLTNFKNYIFSEDVRILISFLKLIYIKKPFSYNVINIFRYQLYKSNNEASFSSDVSDESSQSSFEVLDYLSLKKFKFYKIKNKRLFKFKAVVIDNNIFIFQTDKDTKIEIFQSVIPLSIYFIKKGTAILKDRSLFYLTFNLKFSNSLPSYNDKYFFKLNNSFYEFLERINYSIEFNDFSRNYKYLKDAGQGSYGKVCLFENVHLDKKIAVKKISKRRNEVNMDTVINEIDILKFLKNNPNENIIKVEHIIEDYDFFYLVMEYLPCNLTTYLSSNRKDCNKNDITKQIANGLKFLHSNGIIHRDIKNDNILIDYDQMNVKIIDFGLSKVLYKYEFTNEPYGTIAFSAPELLNKHSYNFKVDFWSYGVLIYLIYYNYHPYENELKLLSLDDLMDFVNLKFSTTFSETVDPCINLIIKGCFEKEPMYRNLITIMNE